MIKSLLKKDILDLVPYEPHDYEYECKMDANESPFNLDKEIVSNIIKRLEVSDYNRYPETNSVELKKEISKYIDVDYKNIIVGNGSDELINITLNTFVEKGDIVMAHNPSFSMYGIDTKITGGVFLEVPTDENFNINEEKIISEANNKNIKLLFLCTPNNPTGNKISKKAIKNILDKTSCIVVVDEAYIEFGGETVIGEVEKESRLIVLRTFSKGLGGAGIRLGYLASNSNIANRINIVKPPYNLNFITQIAGIEIIKKIDLAFKKIEIIIRERDFLISEMRKIPNIKVYDSFANFILFKVENGEKVFNNLLDKGIMVRYFDKGRLENHLRVSIGEKEENKKFLISLKEVI